MKLIYIDTIDACQKFVDKNHRTLEKLVLRYLQVTETIDMHSMSEKTAHVFVVCKNLNGPVLEFDIDLFARLKELNSKERNLAYWYRFINSKSSQMKVLYEQH